MTGIYIDTLTPVASVFLTFLALTAIKFLRTEREKSFVRNAWGHYLSSEVINDLIANPEKLNLGGEKKVMTAMFTDVRGFSSISEVLDPTALVHLINLYLTEMSDIILELAGHDRQVRGGRDHLLLRRAGRSPGPCAPRLH